MLLAASVFADDADQKQSLGPARDTFPDAPLIRYRLSSKFIDYALLDAYRGQSKVLQLHLRNSGKSPRSDALDFADAGFFKAKALKPFAPVIPPYVGLNAETFSIKILDTSGASGTLAGKSIRLEKASIAASPPPLVLKWENATIRQDAGADGWREYTWTLPDPGQISRQIAGVQFISNTLPGADEFIYIAQPTLTGKGFANGYDLLTTDAPLLTTGMTAPLAPRPAKPLPTRDTLTLGGYAIHKPDMQASLPALTAFIKKEFPAWDFILAPVWLPPMSIGEEIKKLPDGVYYQFQKAQLIPDYLIASGIMPRNARGEAMKSFGNAVLATHPALQAGLKDEIDYAASLGINNFKQIDMIWYFQGGRWGYDEASVAAFRDDLSETDEGLLLLPGLPGGGKLKRGGVIHFWDYYEYYHGFRPKPADIGLASWGDYTPVSEQQAADGGDIEKRNLGVFILLYHYEWLRQGQRFGRWAKARQGVHSFTLNPEDLGNGGDYVFLTFLADAGTPYIEYFGGPSSLRGAYHNLPSYVHAATLAGKKLGLTLEKGQGGHGQHYYDPETNYLYAQELAAAGLRGYHNEWTESNWQRMSDPANGYLYDRWSNWMTGALGFAFAREEHMRRPETRVFTISVRSPGYYVSSWIWGLKQDRSFGGFLAENHVPYKQYDRSALPEILEQADVIFYSPLSGRAQDWTLLREWLKKPGKSLVTHTNVPFLLDDGQARLVRGTKDVIYTSIDQRYSDFIVQKEDFKSVVFPEFRALRPLASGTWSAIPGARILLGEKNVPLLSSLPLAGGSRIVYLHKAPLDFDSSGQREIFETLAGQLKLPRMITTSSAPVMAHQFELPWAKVLNVWTGLDKAGFRGGYGAHLLPRRGANQFDRHNRPYPWLEQGRDVTVTVPVNEAGVYRVYAFLSGQENVIATTPQNTLNLRIRGNNAEQFYYARDSAATREKIEYVKKHRERLFPWCPDIEKNK
jgi:hypothetical protein